MQSNRSSRIKYLIFVDICSVIVTLATKKWRVLFASFRIVCKIFVEAFCPFDNLFLLLFISTQPWAHWVVLLRILHPRLASFLQNGHQMVSKSWEVRIKKDYWICSCLHLAHFSYSVRLSLCCWVNCAFFLLISSRTLCLSATLTRNLASNLSLPLRPYLLSKYIRRLLGKVYLG